MAEQIDPSLTVQKIDIENNDLKFKTPFGMLVSGPSQSGKSEFLFNFIKYRKEMFTENFERIIYCQPNSFSTKNQTFFARLKNEFNAIELCEGLPSISNLDLNVHNSPVLLLIDDLMSSVLFSKQMVDLLSNDVHNFNISVIIVLQNYFASGKYGKTLIRNCQYRVFFYSRVQQLELRTVSSQISNNPAFFAANFEFLYEKYPNAPSHYLLIDGHFRTKSANFWCRSNIFPQENGEINPIIFFPTTPNSSKSA